MNEIVLLGRQLSSYTVAWSTSAIGPEAVIERKKWTAMLESYEVHVIVEQYDFKFDLPTDSTPHGAATAPIAACAVRSRFQQRSRT
jgi:hypothetical protein